jgi:hypothetical protein
MENSLSQTPEMTMNSSRTQAGSSAPAQPKPKSSTSTLVLALAFLGFASAAGYLGYMLGLRQAQSESVAQTTLNSQKKSANSNINTESDSEPTPTPTPNKDTQKYLNDQHHFSFEYPKTWTAQTPPENKSYVYLDSKPFEIQMNTEFSTPIQVYVREDLIPPGPGVMDSNLRGTVAFFKESFYGESTDITERDLTINGYPAVQLSGKLGPGMLSGHDFTTTVVPLSKQAVLIIALHNNPQFKSTYDQIVESLQPEFSE